MQHSKSLVEDYLDSIFIKFSFNLSANICPASTGRIIYDCNRFVFKINFAYVDRSSLLVYESLSCLHVFLESSIVSFSIIERLPHVALMVRSWYIGERLARAVASFVDRRKR